MNTLNEKQAFETKGLRSLFILLRRDACFGILETSSAILQE